MKMLHNYEKFHFNRYDHITVMQLKYSNKFDKIASMDWNYTIFFESNIYLMNESMEHCMKIVSQKKEKEVIFRLGLHKILHTPNVSHIHLHTPLEEREEKKKNARQYWGNATIGL